MSQPSQLQAWVASNPQQTWFEPGTPAPAKGPADLELDGTRHQPWEGFGGCFNEMGWESLSLLDDSSRQAILRDLFDPKGDCRFNLCRMPIGANDYALNWYSLDETDGDFAMEQFSIEHDRQYLIPYIKAAQAYRPDLQLFASPWSPPTWMKRPRVYNHGTFVWDKRYLDAYALYFVKFVQAYAAEGIAIGQVHPQNEPTADQKFPSCVWRGAQLRDFIRDHMGPAFRDHRVPAEIWLGTINSDDYDEYALTVLSDPLARGFVSGVGYQWAGKGAIQRTAESWPDIKLMQTENECGDGTNTWAYAHYVFGLMRHYITNGVRAYVYWNMVLPPGGVSTWGWRQNAMVTIDPATHAVTRNPEFQVMKHFAHFIEPGAIRLGVKGPLAGNAVAFLNPGWQIVVAVNNPFETPREARIDVNGVRRAFALPAQSVNTLVFGE
jgi:glucosylceramidase